MSRAILILLDILSGFALFASNWPKFPPAQLSSSRITASQNSEKVPFRSSVTSRKLPGRRHAPRNRTTLGWFISLFMATYEHQMRKRRLDMIKKKKKDPYFLLKLLELFWSQLLNFRNFHSYLKISHEWVLSLTPSVTSNETNQQHHTTGRWSIATRMHLKLLIVIKLNDEDDTRQTKRLPRGHSTVHDRPCPEISMLMRQTIIRIFSNLAKTANVLSWCILR